MTQEKKILTCERWSEHMSAAGLRSIHEVITEQMRKRNAVLEEAARKYAANMPWWKRRFFKKWWLRRELVIVVHHDRTQSLRTRKGETLVSALPPEPPIFPGGYPCRHQLVPIAQPEEKP